MRLNVRTIKDAVVVPVTALRHGGTGDYRVRAQRRATVALRPVTRGQATVDKVQITTGLKVGEQVITEGADRLRDGSRVALPGDAPAAGRRGGGARRRRDAAPHGRVARWMRRPHAVRRPGPNAMSPSRPFIQRPVATSLLMLAIVLAGMVGFRFLPLSALPQVDYPDHPGADPVSGRQPGGDGAHRHRAAGAPVRPDVGPASA